MVRLVTYRATLLAAEYPQHPSCVRGPHSPPSISTVRLPPCRSSPTRAPRNSTRGTPQSWRAHAIGPRQRAGGKLASEIPRDAAAAAGICRCRRSITPTRLPVVAAVVGLLTEGRCMWRDVGAVCGFACRCAHALHLEKAIQTALFKKGTQKPKSHSNYSTLCSSPRPVPASRPGGAFLGGGKEARSTPILHRRPLGLLLPRQSELLSRPQDPPRDGGTRVSLKARLTSPSSGVSSGGACGAIKDQYARNPSRCGRGSRSPGKTKPARSPL